MRRAVLLALASLLPVSPLKAQRVPAGERAPTDSTAIVTGTVIETGSGRPLGGASVRLLSAGAEALTDSAGRFRFEDLAPGRDTLRVAYLGNATATGVLRLTPGRVTRVEVELDPFAVEVSELTVEVERRRNARMRGIHRRAERRPGSVLLREEIEEVGTVRLTDALRRMPGVRVRYVPPRYRGSTNGSAWVVLLRGPSGFRGRCRPSVYLNGAPVRGITVNEFDPEEVEAVEVYQGGTEPPEFMDMRGCGAVAIWLRQG